MKYIKYVFAWSLLITPCLVVPALLLLCVDNLLDGNVYLSLLSGGGTIGLTFVLYQLMDLLSKGK